MPLVSQYIGFVVPISRLASASLVLRGSLSAAMSPLNVSRFAIVAESAIASTTMSRPSSVFPIVQYRARGDALPSASK